MAADAFINFRVTPGTKARVRAVAAHRGITESALLKQLIGAVLQTGTATPELTAESKDRVHRNARLSVRLEPEDWRLLKQKASVRGMLSATYVSVLVSSHLRAAAPLPRAEYLALKQTAGELATIARDLHQVAQAMTQGLAPGPRALPDLGAMRKIAGALRDHIKALLEANAKSWRAQPEQPH
jgi:antitoxin component of RelBE/YafQ-DinJ toxin-antitoxin module